MLSRDVHKEALGLGSHTKIPIAQRPNSEPVHFAFILAWHHQATLLCWFVME